MTMLHSRLARSSACSTGGLGRRNITGRALDDGPLVLVGADDFKVGTYPPLTFHVERDVRVTIVAAYRQSQFLGGTLGEAEAWDIAHPDAKEPVTARPDMSDLQILGPDAGTEP